MKNRRSRFLPRAGDQGSLESPLSLAEMAARHLRWSAAIAGAFRRANALPPWHPTTLTFGLRAKRMLSLVRRVLNFRLSWPRLEQTLGVTNNFLAQPVLYFREGSSPTGRDSRSQTLGPREMPLAFRHSHVRQTFSHDARVSQHHIWPHGPAVARTLWLPPSAGTMSVGLRPNAIQRDARAPEMTTRITRRLRRIEEAPLSPEPRMVNVAAPARGFEEILEAPARKLHRELSPVHHSYLGASAPHPPGMNVTQLTDEVMRQIDRRLVAVRERMGKI